MVLSTVISFIGDSIPSRQWAFGFGIISVRNHINAKSAVLNMPTENGLRSVKSGVKNIKVVI